MKINRVSFQAITSGGPYGFDFEFGSGLNVVRGDNTTGKSTFVALISYALGMEEIIGGIGVKALQYAAYDHLETDVGRVEISDSYVEIEVEGPGGIASFKRAVKSSEKSDKLVYVYEGSIVQARRGDLVPRPMYLHDKGSAQYADTGFFAFLERFLGVSLPVVRSASSVGGSKLYLQPIMAAHIVEQKRGWTDYVANAPFYGISSVKERVIQFVLGLDVFENEQKRIEADLEKSAIFEAWAAVANELREVAAMGGLVVEGVPRVPSIDFLPTHIGVHGFRDGVRRSLPEIRMEMISRRDLLVAPSEKSNVASPDRADLLKKLESIDGKLSIHIESIGSSESIISMNQASIASYEGQIVRLDEELRKLRISEKLVSFGASENLVSLAGHCPSCHQSIGESITSRGFVKSVMPAGENAAYLESQKRLTRAMLEKLSSRIASESIRLESLKGELSELRAMRYAIQEELGQTAGASEVEVREKVSLEVGLEQLEKFERALVSISERMVDVSVRYRKYKELEASLPREYFSEKDSIVISHFERRFKSLIERFKYGSAKVSDISIARSNLMPCLLDSELREISSKRVERDASASDFVRLIWAYLLALSDRQVGSGGNHFGFVIFDEPGQHSMSLSSMNELLLEMSGRGDVQSIVAASFEESDAAYRAATAGVQHRLIHLGRKLIQPIS